MSEAEIFTKYDFITPTEGNEYCLFPDDLENDPNVFFHATSSSNLNSILSKGFRSAKDLGVGDLTSVSYANRSSGCLAHNKISQGAVVFIVTFTTINKPGFKINASDINVYVDEQPKILGYCELPQGFTCL